MGRFRAGLKMDNDSLSRCCRNVEGTTELLSTFSTAVFLLWELGQISMSVLLDNPVKALTFVDGLIPTFGGERQW